MQRMNGATEPVLQTWFHVYKDIITQFNIQEKDIYNMDEIGFSISTLKSTRIIVDSTYRTYHQAHSGRQEWVSIVECICADTSLLRPSLQYPTTRLASPPRANHIASDIVD
jgi:hypothetical protein